MEDESFSSDQSTDIEDELNIKYWLNCHFHDKQKEKIKKPDEIQDQLPQPTSQLDQQILDRVKGSFFGMAIGDALGAHVEFRPRQYLVENPVLDLQGGGTWGLEKGQFTDDTSMALCLANSLICCEEMNCYDQLVRYKWWFQNGYMSSTGHCFDIGQATRQSLQEFISRQNLFAQQNHLDLNQIDFLNQKNLLDQFNVYCSQQGVAGNGPLMRLSPVPIFFYQNPILAVEYSGISALITHGDTKAYDACRYFGALIVAAIDGESKQQLLDDDFYLNHQPWFHNKPIHQDVIKIAQGSYKKKGGYQDGIRGKGYIIDALEAALWAFWQDEDSFEKGVLDAINLGDDTDTTAAIYGQLAGIVYGFNKLPQKWIQQLYAQLFIEKISKWITFFSQQQFNSHSLTNIDMSTPIHQYQQDLSILINAPIKRQQQQTSVNDKTPTIEITEPSDPPYDSDSDNIDIPQSSSINLQENFTNIENKFSSKEHHQPITHIVQLRSSHKRREFSPNRMLMYWNVDDVCQWIKSFGKDYSNYIENFRNDHTDGFRLYNFINNQTLIQFGIQNQQHRQQILNSIELLRRKVLNQVYP